MWVSVSWEDQDLKQKAVSRQVNGNTLPWRWDVSWSGVGASEVKHQHRITVLSQIELWSPLYVVRGYCICDR